MKRWWMVRIVKGVVFIAVMTLVLGFVVMGLWNALIPELFNGPVLTFWQAIGLLLLSHIMLRGWMPGGHMGGWRHEGWRKRFEAKLAAMTPEEREKFRNQWHNRCHSWGEGGTESDTEKE